MKNYIMRDVNKESILLFLLWPFGGFLYSLFHFKTKSSFLIFILFFMLIGYFFTFQNTYADSYGYAIKFVELCKSKMNLSNVLDQYLNGDLTDVYTFIVSIGVSFFSEEPNVLFAFYGLIFGTFSYLCLKLQVKDRLGKLNIYFLILLFLFAFLNPYSNLNGVRFWTATFVFYYSLVNILYHKIKWITGLLLTSLIHFSFIIPVFVVLIYFIFQKRLGVFWALFLLSVIFVLFEPLKFSFDNIVFLNGVFEKKFIDYTNTESIANLKNINSSSSVVYNIYMKSKIYYSIILLFFVKFKYCEIKKRKYFKELYGITLLMFSFSNFVYYIPSMSRFMTLSFMLLFFLLFKIYNLNRTRTWQIFILIAPILFALDIYISINLGNSLISSKLFFINIISVVS